MVGTVPPKVTAKDICAPGTRDAVPVQVRGADPVQAPDHVVEPVMESVQPVAPAKLRAIVAVPEGIVAVPVFFTTSVREGEVPPTSTDCVICRVDDVAAEFARPYTAAVTTPPTASTAAIMMNKSILWDIALRWFL